MKETRDLGDQSKQELKIVQRKYEEEIERKEAQIESVKLAMLSGEERMQFEIAHLKGELEK